MHLVDLINKDDAVALGKADGLLGDDLCWEHALCLALLQHRTSLWGARGGEGGK